MLGSQHLCPGALWLACHTYGIELRGYKVLFLCEGLPRAPSPECLHLQLLYPLKLTTNGGGALNGKVLEAMASLVLEAMINWYEIVSLSMQSSNPESSRTLRYSNVMLRSGFIETGSASFSCAYNLATRLKAQCRPRYA